MSTTETRAVIRYTTAPDAYDAPTTTTVDPDAGIDDRGNPIRLVMIRVESLAWQEARYCSGPHACVGAEKISLFRAIWTMRGEIR